MSELILGLETSCDETAASVITSSGTVLSNIISSQAELQDRYGGVVPEVASRRHLELVGAVVLESLHQAEASLSDIDRMGVTQGPGLIGALLVGLSYAKGLCWAKGIPLVLVDHLKGHIASLFLNPNPLDPPFLCLLASGGHTLLGLVVDHKNFEVIGGTRDDAAGEAFDKGARLLGLRYPGGPELDQLAKEGDPELYKFPVARVDGLDFSFSGVKTSLLYTIREMSSSDLAVNRPHLAASYQRAIVTALLQKLEKAIETTGMDKVAVVGGVAANSVLRAALKKLGAHVAPLEFCTDNGAMIASAARYTPSVSSSEYLVADAYPSR